MNSDASDPVSCWRDGTWLTTATSEDSRTLKNVRTQPKVRAVWGTGDVLMRSVPGFTYIQLVPERMQVGKGVKEFADGR